MTSFGIIHACLCYFYVSGNLLFRFLMKNEIFISGVVFLFSQFSAIKVTKKLTSIEDIDALHQNVRKKCTSDCFFAKFWEFQNIQLGPFINLKA